MNEIASANNKMLEEQKRDKEQLTLKQKRNNEAINTRYCQPTKLDEDAQALTTAGSWAKVAVNWIWQLKNQLQKTRMLACRKSSSRESGSWSSSSEAATVHNKKNKRKAG